jgi:plasmid stabilization system protein ParE
MGFKVILTPQSLDDLTKIVTFIARDNSGRARTFGNELVDRALATAAFPELGRMEPEIGERPSAKSSAGHTGSSTKFFPTEKPFMCCASGTAQEANRKSNQRFDSESP